MSLQVSEVYSLHRQTTYLAQDFFDRFMLTQEDISKDYLQLIGITALFIASKIEVSVFIYRAESFSQLNLCVCRSQ